MERKKLCLTKNLVDKRQKFFILRYGVNLLTIKNTFMLFFAKCLIVRN